MAYDSNGYIMIDFAEVDFRRTNQTIEGLFDRCQKVIGANKFVIVINANGKTPLPSTVCITNGKYVIESVLFTFSISSSDNLHITKKTTPEELIDDDHVTLKTTFSSDKIMSLLEGGHTYSTDEKMVGTWVDGSPIYEKTYHILPTGNTDNTTFDVISDLSTIVSMMFTAKRFDNVNNHIWFYTGDGSVVPEPAAYRDYKIAVRTYDNNLQYSIAGYGAEITDIWCTVQYTKVISP